MKFSLKNVGKISSAELEINGITVIAGENNTGKSTIGKALFAVFNSLYKIDELIRAEKMLLIEKIINDYCMQNYLESDKNNAYDFFGKQGFEKINDVPLQKISHQLTEFKTSQWEKAEIKKSLLEFFYNYDKTIDSYIDLSKIDNLVNRLYRRLLISNRDSVGVLVQRVLNKEFFGQVKNLNTDGKTEIVLKIGKREIVVSYDENDNLHISDNIIALKTALAYIDDPFVIDALDNESHFNYRHKDKLMHVDQHTEHLKTLLLRKSFNNPIEEVIINDKLKTIYDKISQVSSGDVLQEKSELIYKDKGNSFRLSNLSTGLKTFVIIKMLLLNGAIEEKATIILDEPEIHLHPEWQLLFAETIVLMQKEFDLHILLNTHSPYFLEAIEKYSEKYGVAERCKYYLSEKDESASSYTVKDVTNNTEEIYALLADAFQTLENEC